MKHSERIGIARNSAQVHDMDTWRYVINGDELNLLYDYALRMAKTLDMIAEYEERRKEWEKK